MEDLFLALPSALALTLTLAFQTLALSPVSAPALIVLLSSALALILDLAPTFLDF